MSTPRLITICMPNPYFEKDNNAYLIDAGKLILIDTGVDTPEAFSTLQRSLEENNYNLKDISKIFLTHKHLDHFGLVHRMVTHSQAEVFIHSDDHLDVTQFNERDELVSNLYVQRMREWGVPDNILDMIEMRNLLTNLGQSIEANAVEDEDILQIGELELRVIHTPGHTQGSCCYEVGHWLFTGDHLLPTYTPNIGATDVTANNMLAKYRDSLQKIREIESERTLPGHGHEIENVKMRVDEILQHHQDREGRLVQILKDDRPQSVYEIALELFGELKDHHVLLGAGEVHAHLEDLEAAGHVRLVNNKYTLS